MNRIARSTLAGAAFFLIGPPTLRAHEAPIATTQTAQDPSAHIAPVAARYEVSVSAAPQVTGPSTTPAPPLIWHFFRTAQQVAVLKGPIDEVWHRDAQGRLRFERVFHGEQRVVNYSTGELATLGIHASWRALASFVDPELLGTLRQVSTTGAGDSERVHLVGRVGNDTLRVDWMPAWQLPARVQRTGPQGATSDIRLTQHAATPPSDWPRPGANSAQYLRLDAADFGDMGYESVVRQSEALDVRLGWRAAHEHH